MSFTLQADVSFTTPPYTGQPNCPVPITFSVTYDHKACYRFELSGSGTQTVDFGSMPAVGAKAIMIAMDADTSPAAQPININVNSGTDNWELSPGGFLSYGSPDPSTGITAMDLVYSVDFKAWVWLFG